MEALSLQMRTLRPQELSDTPTTSNASASVAWSRAPCLPAQCPLNSSCSCLFPTLALQSSYSTLSFLLPAPPRSDQPILAPSTLQDEPCSRRLTASQEVAVPPMAGTSKPLALGPCNAASQGSRITLCKGGSASYIKEKSVGRQMLSSILSAWSPPSLGVL